jgi:hypothetical protein
MLLSPSSNHHYGTLSYTVSDNIQLIIFSGPLKPEENNKMKHIVQIMERGNMRLKLLI